jgi:hypothetical protein
LAPVGASLALGHDTIAMPLFTRWSVGAKRAPAGLSCSVPSVVLTHLVVGEKSASIDFGAHDVRRQLDAIVDALERFTIPLMTLLDASERQAPGIDHVSRTTREMSKVTRESGGDAKPSLAVAEPLLARSGEMSLLAGAFALAARTA